MTGITGRDDYIVAKALYLAIKFIDTLPPEKRARSDQSDMQKILDARYAQHEAMLTGMDMNGAWSSPSRA
jgi:hypothetical protein